ncbi:OsmC family protein [Halobium salinum]|uniref:OsmC family protein n=1 Tax=Halobium salinum TaxID=1364940 RepID=A0ABD5PC02_9EURY|nr:OsmC family protein [Halobium salinum]
MSDAHRQSTKKTYRLRTDTHGPRKATVRVRDHAFTVDAPEASGGTDEGPTPVEYLLGALAGCVNVTGSRVASDMDIDLTVTGVDIEADIDPARFVGADTDARAGFDPIRVTVGLDTTEDEATVTAWLAEMESRNPVLDNLIAPTAVAFGVTR